MDGSLSSSAWRPVALAAVVLVLALGCHQRSDTPQRSQNAGLTALTVQGGVSDISPTFAASTFAYTLKTNHSSTPGSLIVTAILADPNATMTLNGTTLTSGTPSAAIPLKVGANTLSLVVTAQDRSTAQTFTIAEQINAPNTTVYVLSAENGSPVPGATLTLADASGTVLQSGLAVDASGKAMLGLDFTSKYNISASAVGMAQSLIAGFDPSRETVASLYCLPLGTTTLSAPDPQAPGLAYGKDSKAWTPPSGEALRDTLANLATLNNPILSERDKVQPDRQRNDQATGSPGEPATPLPSGSTKRTEPSAQPNITAGAGDPTQPDLSGLRPSKIVVQVLSRSQPSNHPSDQSVTALSSKEASPTTAEVELSFSLLNASAEGQIILGFEVYRSTDSKAWTRVAINQFATLTVASRLSWSDKDPSLQAGLTYYYLIRCFNRNTSKNGGYSQYSSPAATDTVPHR